MHSINPQVRHKRCAIYTRKSTDCTAGQEINSLQGQREVCSAFIKCQEHRGWSELAANYDDEGFSGKDLARPALCRLLRDAREGQIDVIVFYKIDRLTRSLPDFVRLMDSLKYLDIAFVSVTQSFDTSDSMGRMILNILLTFAQFEREMMGDRIRDKKTTLKRNGFYVGRAAPLGYELSKGRLTPHASEAALIVEMFERLPNYPSACSLLKAMDAEGARERLSPSRNRIRRLQDGSTYRMFRNPLYIGFQEVEGELVPGTHEALVSKEAWDRAQEILGSRVKTSNVADTSRYPLVELIYDDFGRRLGPRSRGTKRWPERYYESPSKSPGKPKYHDKVRVNAYTAECLSRSMILALLDTPQDLRRVLVRGIAGAESIETLTTKGQQAADRMRRADPAELRQIYEAIVARIEVSRSEFRIWIIVPELACLLEWNGWGLYSRQGQRWEIGSQTYMLAAEANLFAPHSDFRIIAPVSIGDQKNRALISLLLKAGSAERDFLGDPERDLARLSAAAKMTVCKYSRLLRLNYLAPDIKAAILDGRQPAKLTAHQLLYAPIPADWQQQRELLGFERPTVN